MLIVSVVVIAVVAAAFTFVPTFRDGVQDLATDVETILNSGMIGTAGTQRNGGSNGNSTMGTDAPTCSQMANDPRYGAMYDPPPCIPDPAPVPIVPPPAEGKPEERQHKVTVREPLAPVRKPATASAALPPHA